MKKKTILITSAIVLLLAVITTIIVISVNRGKVKVFTDTNYPGFYKQKDNNIVFRLKDKNNSDVPWQIEEESGIVEVATKGEGTGKKVSFTFAPKAPGITDLRLYKSKELFGFNIDIVSVEIPINITENESGLAVNMLGAPTLTDNGGGVGGKDTDNPYVLLNNGDGTARVVFVKGQNDWRISDSSNMANLEWAVIEENMDSCWISENASYDPNAEVVSTEATEEGEDGGDADSEGESEKSSGTKPSKTAKDVANMTISDEEYESGSIDLSEYMVDGEIPEDVLKELDKKLEKMAKERGEDVPDDSATEVSEATTERRTEATTERTTEAAVEATTESSSEAAAPDNSSEETTESSSEAAAEGSEETAVIDSEAAAEIGSTEEEDNGLDATMDYSGLYDGYNMMYDYTVNGNTDGNEEGKEETSDEAYTIDPETGELVINEDVLNKRRTTVVKETILSVSSEQYKTIEYIKVSFMADGNIVLSISKKGPKK